MTAGLYVGDRDEELAGTLYEGVESETDDPSIARESEMRERALFYVAATHARKEVVITSFGTPSGFLK